MPSKPETIERANRAKNMRDEGMGIPEIANALGCSKSLVNEYLERNAHPTSCSSCRGYGISKNRSSGVKVPICKDP